MSDFSDCAVNWGKIKTALIKNQRKTDNKGWGKRAREAVAIQILPIGSLHITQICMKPEGLHTYYVMCWLPITAISVHNTARGRKHPCLSMEGTRLGNASLGASCWQWSSQRVKKIGLYSERTE